MHVPDGCLPCVQNGSKVGRGGGEQGALFAIFR